MKLDTKAYRVDGNKRVKLSRFDPDDVGPFNPDASGKAEARALLKTQKKTLAELQNLLYADSSRSLLIVLQALDAGGKDSTIRKVMSGINPQGVQVTSFKAPTQEELAHDFLWRIHKATPKLGMIGVFNRSHYEDILAVRVKNLAPKKVWSKRYEAVNSFEETLNNAGTAIIKIYLNISRDEQKERFEDRLNEPDKHWKFNPGDLEDRERWEDYQKAFEDIFNKCSTKRAPWYIIPANRKWYRNVLVAGIIIKAIKSMKLNYPSIDYDPSEITIPD